MVASRRVTTPRPSTARYHEPPTDLPSNATPVTCTWWAPAGMPGGKRTTVENEPSGPTVTAPRLVGSECSVIVLDEPGANPVAVTVAVCPVTCAPTEKPKTRCTASPEGPAPTDPGPAPGAGPPPAAEPPPGGGAVAAVVDGATVVGGAAVVVLVTAVVTVVGATVVDAAGLRRIAGGRGVGALVVVVTGTVVVAGTVVVVAGAAVVGDGGGTRARRSARPRSRWSR